MPERSCRWFTPSSGIALVFALGPVSAQSDLYRLTYVIEQLKSQGWVNAAVSDGDWDNEALLVQEYSDTDALLVRKSALNGGFSDEGKLSACMAILSVNETFSVGT